MTHGRHVFTGMERDEEVRSETAEQWVTRMKKIQDEASAALTFAQDVMKRQYDKHHSSSIEYKKGDLV